MTHTQFIEKLKEFGFVIKINHLEKGSSDYTLCINDDTIGGSNYGIFGYYCGGQYTPCARTKKEEFSNEDFENALKWCIEHQKQSIQELNSNLSFQDIRTEFNEVYNNDKLKKYVRSSAKIMYKYLNENYNDLLRKKKLRNS